MIFEKLTKTPGAVRSSSRFFLLLKRALRSLDARFGYVDGSPTKSLLGRTPLSIAKELSDFVSKLDRRLLANLLVSVALHIFVIFVLGGAESTGKSRGDVHAARITKPMQLLLSEIKPNQEETPSEELKEEFHSEDTIPRNQSTKAKPADQSEASQGDQQLVVGPLSEMQYFKAKELDRRPIAQSFVDTTFPGVEEYPSGGWAILTLWVNEAGFVDSVRVEESSFPKSLLDPVVDRYRGIMFSPAEKDGRKVRARMKILIEYPDVRSSLMGTARKK